METKSSVTIPTTSVLILNACTCS